jgi:hypothetical protein
VKDDFVWIARSRLETPADWAALFGAPTGFFRPAVSLTFAANRSVCGLHPLCYGLTNLALAIGCAAGIFATARGLSLPPGAALLAAALWAFNWHGINMAVLWISGRILYFVLRGRSGAFTPGSAPSFYRLLDQSFGTLLQAAAALAVSPPISVWIDPPPADAVLAGLTRPARFDVELAVNGGRITRTR